MAHKTLIDGTAFDISGGKTLIGGTGYGIKSGKTMIDGTGYAITLEKPFANHTWAEIIAACQNGEIPENWVAGDSKTMTIGGVDYQIDIIGKNHDIYTVGGTAPLTFQLHECCPTTYAMVATSSTDFTGGYGDTLMHQTHLPAIKGTMPSEVQAAIKPVNKLTSVGNRDSTIETVSCELFLLSEIEIFGSAVRTYAGEGSQYDYYKNGGSKIKYPVGTDSAVEWFERSPAKYTSSFGIVNSRGGSDYVGNLQVGYARSVSFAFCF